MDQILLSLFGWLFSQINPATTFTTPPSPTPPITTSHQISYQDTTYNYHYFVVNDHYRLQLIPNFQHQTKSAQIKTDRNCSFIINAGYYTTANQPLGLFVSPEFKHHTIHSQQLTNAFYSISPDGQPSISSLPPPAASYIAIQSGPLLLMQNSPQDLQLNSDKNSRRSVIATTKSNQTVFIFIYSTKSTLAGPKLQQLPQLISLINQKHHLALDQALNLDGGSASTYHHQQTSIPELNPVGSFFCYQ